MNEYVVSPIVRSMKPKPFSFENHLTVPSANTSSFYNRVCKAAEG